MSTAPFPPQRAASRPCVWLCGAALLSLVLVSAWPLMQRIPNGADHYFMIDVGEVQIVLNTWGTLHPTGYPLYVVLGNLTTMPLRALGVRAATAASLVSLTWGVAAFGVLYALAVRLVRRPALALAVLGVYALTRTVWVHHIIAELYSFGLLLLAGLLALALWTPPVRGRLFWLALLGGVAVAHHRALAMSAPALLLAAWPDLTRPLRALPRKLMISLGLGLVGFLPYVYLVLRARAGAPWVYGDPSNVARFLEQFFSREYDQYITLPTDAAALTANVGLVNTVLLTDLSTMGVLVGLVGLGLALASRVHRRSAAVLTLSAGVAYLFHAVFYTDVLSALILPVTLSLAFGWLLGIDLLLRAWPVSRVPRWVPAAVVGVVLAVLGSVLATRNAPFLHALVTDPAGMEVIALVEGAPPGSVVMLPWGPLHFAVGYARDIEGGLAHITLVDHKADVRGLLADGTTLVTPEFIQYTYPPAWWAERAGAPVWAVGVAPSLVQVMAAPWGLVTPPPEQMLAEAEATCADASLTVIILWAAPATPQPDQAVFVHLLAADGTLLAQADLPAPAYGWHPVSSWGPGEMVRDVVALPAHAAMGSVRYGLYRQDEDGTFVNTFERDLAVTCAV